MYRNKLFEISRKKLALTLSKYLKKIMKVVFQKESENKTLHGHICMLVCMGQVPTNINTSI